MRGTRVNRYLSRRHRPCVDVLESRWLLANITGTVIRDLDADGVVDAGETGHSGVTVYLDQNRNDIKDVGEASTATNAGGAYTFAGLSAGLHTVAEQVPSGWTQTAPALSTVAPITRASIGLSGAPANNGSTLHTAISGDGQLVAFQSTATNLVSGDTNLFEDVFVYSRPAGTVQRVSVSSGGTQSNSSSTLGGISGDGRYVAFHSLASNLVVGDTNGRMDVFVFDRVTATQQRVSVGTGGAQSNSDSADPALSGDGRYVAFSSFSTNLVAGDTNLQQDIFVYDRQTGTTQRVSVGSGGIQSNGVSFSPKISADGRYITFASDASNLVANDTNGQRDVFVYDRQTGTTQRVNVASDGTQANDYAFSGGVISADGRYVGYGSYATNLVPGDTNGIPDLFVYDRQTGVTQRVNVSATGQQADTGNSSFISISGDGRYVAFSSDARNLVQDDTNNLDDVYVIDRVTGDLKRVSVSAAGAQGIGDSSLPAISADGRSIAFMSNAENLVSGDTNVKHDIFVTGNPLVPATRATSVLLSSADVTLSPILNHQAPVISGTVFVDSNSNGSKDAAESGLPGATVYIDTNSNYVLDAGELSVTSRSDDPATTGIDEGGTYQLSPTFAGSYVVRTIMPSGYSQSFPVLAGGIFERSSVISGGAQATGGASYRGSLSGDGRYLVFSSGATNLVSGDTNGTDDIFVRDRQTGAVQRVNVSSAGVQANNTTFWPAISQDGRYVTFLSYANNLVAGDNNSAVDVFVFDRQTATIQRVDVSASGVEASNGAYSIPPSISGDGRYVAFTSSSPNLVANDTNSSPDAFVYDRQTSTIQRVSVNSSGVEANAGTGRVVISQDGRYVAMTSSATNLVPNDTNLNTDVFVYDRQTGAMQRVSVDVQGQQGNGLIWSEGPLSFSADGRLVAFASRDTTLVPGDNNGVEDVFVYDRQTGLIERDSIAFDGAQGNQPSGYNPSGGGVFSGIILSGDGRYVVYTSDATNLVSGDTNSVTDVFAYDRVTGAVRRVSRTSANAQSSSGGTYPMLSADGLLVGFTSDSTNLVSGDTNIASDVFLSSNTLPAVPVATNFALSMGQQVQLNVAAASASLITGTVWLDRDIDQTFDPIESGMSDVLIALYRDNGDGTFNVNSDSQVGTVKTNATGAFQRSGLLAGSYWIAPVSTSSALTGAKPSTSASPRLVQLAANGHPASVSFGYYKPITVTTIFDQRDATALSLRDALSLAAADPGWDVIEFSSALTGTITLNDAFGHLAVDSDLTLSGRGASTISIAAAATRAMYVSANVNISALSIRGGHSNFGAGIYVSEGGNLRLDSVVIESNAATLRGGGIFGNFGSSITLVNSIVRSNVSNDNGGGIASDGALTILNSSIYSNAAESATAVKGRGGGIFAGGLLSAMQATIYGNNATYRGGGIYVAGDSAVLTNVTLVRNRADSDGNNVGQGGGVYSEIAEASLDHAAIAQNYRGTATAPDDFTGAVELTSDFSFVGTDSGMTGLVDGLHSNHVGTSAQPLDPRLRVLADYGGPTPTALPYIDSPLIDGGSDALVGGFDQRGLPRAVAFNGGVNARRDIGAVEVAKVIVVDSTLDETTDTDGKISLREAVNLASAQAGFDVIRFAPALYASGPLLLTVGSLTVSSALEIQGATDGKISLSIGGLSIASGAVANLSDVTLRGAGVVNAGTLTLSRVLVTNNFASGNGGGIRTTGALTLLNSTVSGNSTLAAGGGVYVAAGGSLSAVNSTIYGNSGSTAGGVVVAAGGSATFSNTLVAGNSGPSDVSGVFNSASSFNFIGAIDGSTGLNGAGTQFGTSASPANPKLLALADNGGPTFTHGVLPASPLTDSGSDALANAAGLLLDQRSLPRFKDGNGDGTARVDIGAFEQQVPLNIAPTLTSVSTLPGAVEGVSFVIPYSLLLSSSDASDADGNAISFRITSVTSGTLTLNGSPVVPGTTLLSSGQSLLWTPPAINFGTDKTKVLSAFSVTAWDGQVASSTPVPVSIEVTTTAEPVNYAVLFSGGDRTDLNYPIYYQNLRRLYEIITTQYGVLPHNVSIVYADGADPGLDQRGNINSDMSFATGATVLSATGANLRSALTNVATKADANDHFFLWTFDHGLGSSNQPGITGEEVLKGWGSGEEIADEQLRAWTQGLKPGESAATFGVPNGYSGIHALHSTYVFAQCFAGGMLDDFDLTNASVFGAASSNHYEPSYADYFAGAFNDALDRGYVNTLDAFQYTIANNGRASSAGSPNGGAWTFNVEHPWQGGGSFSIFATPRDQNAAPDLRSIAPLRIASGATELTITYDMLIAASDATDPTGQALTFRVASEDVGELWRSGHRINLSNTADTTISLGQSILWKKPTGATGTLSAFSLKLIASDGSQSLAKVAPIRVGSPAGLTATDDTKLIQQSSANTLIDVLGNDTGAGTLQVLRVGVAGHGTVSLDPITHQVRYTPAAEYLGNDSFSYLLSNGTTTDLATVSLSMVPFDPQALAAGQRYKVQVLGAPPGWAGLPSAWDWNYRQNPAFNWTESRATDINDQGVVLVRINRAPSGGLDYIGLDQASYRWTAGDVEPFWNANATGTQFGDNTLTFLRPMAFDVDEDGDLDPILQPSPYPDRQIYGGAAALSVKNLAVTPVTYRWTDNAGEFNDPSALLFDADTGGGFWQDLPSDIYVTDVSSTQTNSAHYLASVSNTAASGQRAELWDVSRDGSHRLLQLPGTGGSQRSGAAAINANGWVVGYAEVSPNTFRPFLYNGTSWMSLGVLPGTNEGQAYAVSDTGYVVGFSGSSDADDHSGHGFIWQNGTMSDLPALGGSGWSVAYDVNRDGIAVGASNGLATLWINGQAINLNTQSDQLPSGAVLTEARGINRAGQIVANGTLNGQVRAFFLDLASALDAQPDSVTTSSRRTQSFNVLSNDHGARSVSFVSTAGLQGSLSWTPDGLMTFDPAGQFNDLAPGQQRSTSFSYTARDNLGGTAQTTVTINVTALSTFYVLSSTAGSTGVSMQLSGDVDLSALNLYDGQDASADAADLTLIGPGGSVKGSAVWEDASNTLRFVPTGGTLAPGNYTFSAIGVASGIQSAAAGHAILDGNADDVAGGTYTQNFTVAAPDRILSLPDFARGPGQSVNLPSTSASAGIPLSISDGNGVRSVDFKLVWDPSLLTISAIALDSSMPSGWSVTANLTTAGQAIVSLSGPQPGLTAGAKKLLKLTASVPTTATYLASQAIRIENFVYNNVTTNLIGDLAVQKVAYPGDVTGNGAYGALDASRISRVAVQLDSGFDAMGSTDPLLVADVDADGVVRGFDAALIADAIAGFAVPQLPSLPGTTVTGPDRTVTLGSASLAAGATTSLSAGIDSASGLQGFVYTIAFDPARLDLLSASLGSLLPSGWSYSFNPDEQSGRAKIVAFATSPLPTGIGGGGVFSLSVKALPTAPSGAAPLDLEGSLNDGEIPSTSVDGTITITGGGGSTLPSWLSASAGAATWNAASKTLNVTGSATIIADPGTDLPLITVSGAAGLLNIAPASGLRVNVGGLTLANGAKAIIASLGASRTAASHRLLIVHALSIDANSTLDVTDNDVALDYSGNSPILGVEGLVKKGFNGGDFLGKGITSSTAASEEAGGSFTVAIADNAAMSAPFGPQNGGALFSGVDVDLDTILIKYTHRVDLNLDGRLTSDDAILFSTNYAAGEAAFWTIGDLNYDAVFSSDDAILFSTYYDSTLPAI